MNCDFDVAVVGAGPAGAWAACLLARRGARVLLIDHSHPREKPCGGGITGRALALVADAVDLRTLLAVADPLGPVRRFLDTRPLPPFHSNDRALVVAGRTEFDGALFEAARRAGAAILPARVTKVRSLAGGFELDTTTGPHRAAVIVGADGANSLVRRTLASAFRRDQLSIATGFFAHGVTSRDIVIEFVADPPGYIWSFPRPDHLAIGICAQADRSQSAAGLLRRGRGLDSSHRHRQRAHGSNRTPGRSRRFPRQTSPPCRRPARAGISSATPPGSSIRSRAKGSTSPCCPDSGQPTRFCRAPRRLRTSYARRVREDIGAELGRAARFKDCFFRPRFTRLLIDALQHSAGIRAVMADLVAGQQDYAGLKWRLVKALRPGLAARLIFTATGRHSARRVTACPSLRNDCVRRSTLIATGCGSAAAAGDGPAR